MGLNVHLTLTNARKTMILAYLNKAPPAKSGFDEALGHPSRGIGSGAVHLGVVLATEGRTIRYNLTSKTFVARQEGIKLPVACWFITKRLYRPVNARIPKTNRQFIPECTATMCAPATIGVDDDLASGEAGVAHGAANDEVSAWVDVVFGVLVEVP